MFTLLLVTSLLSAEAAPPDERPSVLLLDMDRCSATPDLCSTIIAALAADPDVRRRYRVVTQSEVAGTLNQLHVKQVAGCDSATCAAEIAGALNTDEVVFGAVSTVGNSFVATLARVRARDAQSLSRVLHRVKRGEEEKFLEDAHAVAVQLFDLREGTAHVASPPPTPPSPVPPVQVPLGKPAPGARSADQGGPRAPMPALLVAGGAGVAVTMLLAVLAVLLVGFNGAVVAADVAQTGRPPWSGEHAVPANVAAAANAALVAGVLLVLLGAVGGLASAVTVAAAWVVP